jgi:hypothetical protein
MTRLITAAALCCIALPAFAANECGHASIDALIESNNQETRNYQALHKRIDPGYVGEKLPPARTNIEMEADLKRACKPGEIVSIPKRQGWLIKSMCDFGKAIVPGGDTVMCVVR